MVDDCCGAHVMSLTKCQLVPALFDESGWYHRADDGGLERLHECGAVLGGGGRAAGYTEPGGCHACLVDAGVVERMHDVGYLTSHFTALCEESEG